MNSHYMLTFTRKSPILFQKWVLSAFLFTLLSGNVFAQTCPNNLIFNAGFENGFQEWGILNSAELTTDANNGNQAVLIHAGFNRINQGLIAEPGQTYTLSAQVKSSPAGAHGSIGIKFLSDTWQPLDEMISSLALSGGFQTIGGLERIAPPNTAYIEVSIYSSTDNDLIVDDVCLTAGNVAALLPDLVPIVQPGVTAASNTEALTYSIAVKNQGTATGFSGSYRGYFSDDDQWSADDEYINVLYGQFQPYEIEPGETSEVINGSYLVPSSNTFNGSKYLLLVVDHLDNYEELDESNNVYAIPVQISTPTGPTDCTTNIGPGDILCTQKNGSQLDVFLENNLIVTKYILDSDGDVVSSQNGGSLITDSVLVQGNQVIKKLYNGAIVFNKTIPPAVLDTLPEVQAAAELTDGTFVLAGYSRVPTPMPLASAKNRLVLVHTDANLNLLAVYLREVSLYYNPFYEFDDKIEAIFAAPNGAFDIFYTSTSYGVTIYQRLDLNRYDFNDPATFDQLGERVSTFVDANTRITKTHCNTYRFMGRTGYASQKGHLFAQTVSFYDVADLSLISQRRFGTGSTDYYGSFELWTFDGRSPDSLSAFFQYRPGLDPIPSMDFILTNSAPPEQQVEVPFFIYDHAARIGTEGLFLFGKRNNGDVFVEVPTDCQTLTPLYPDIVGRFIGINGTDDLQAGEYLHYYFSYENVGEGGTTENFTVRPWISSDTILSADDLAFPTLNVLGVAAERSDGRTDSLLLPTNLPPGEYYLIVEYDTDDSNPEIDENNNTSVTSYTFTVVEANSDDLVIVEVNCPGDFPSATEPITWEITVQNNGSSTSAPTPVYLYNTAPGVVAYVTLELGTANVPALSPGASTTLSITVPPDVHSPNPGFAGYGQNFLLSGIKGISFTPLPLNSGFGPDYMEVDGFPNIYCKKFSTDISVELSATQTSATPSEPLTYTVAVTNNGPDDAYNISSSLFTTNSSNFPPPPGFSAQLSQGAVWEFLQAAGGGTTNTARAWYIPFLAVGETATATVTLTPIPNLSEWPLSGVTFTRTANSLHNTDADLSNNTDDIMFSIYEYSLPDLIPQNLAATNTSVAVGNGFGITLDILNLGSPIESSQIPFATELYLSNDTQLSADDIFLEELLLSYPSNATMGGIVPMGTPPGPYYALVKTDPDDLITESNEANNLAVLSQIITVTDNNGGGEIDLELILIQSNTTPAQWSNYTVQANLINNGGQTATGVKVSFKKQDGVVYAGGNEFVASQGTFNPHGDEVWTVGNIPPGEFATLNVNYFLLEPTAPVAYAQVVAANESDGDSTPNNGTPPTANEDDEASTGGGVGPGCVITASVSDVQCFDQGTGSDPSDDTYRLKLLVENPSNPASSPGYEVNIIETNQSFTGNYGTQQQLTSLPISLGQLTFVITDFVTTDCEFILKVDPPAPCSVSNDLPDLELANLSISNTPIAGGEILDYTFDITNSGNGSASGDFNVKAWISTDNVISSDDVQDGVVPTGNFGAGFAQMDVSGATTVPNGLADGSYFLILKVDADDDVTESDEGNNLLMAPFAIESNIACEVFINESETTCDDNGTPNDATDDIYTLSLNVSGNNLGSHYNLTGGLDASNLPYGSLYTVGQIADFIPGQTILYEVVDASGNCSKTAGIGPLIGCSNGVGGIDLNLGMGVNPLDPAIYSTTAVTISVNNAGPETATNITVDFAKPNDVVYEGGNEWTATQGSFNPHGNQVWTIGSLAAGESASLTVNYFTLTDDLITPYAEIATADGQDVDSTPGNGTCCTPVEDDEASVSINALQGGGGVSLQKDTDRLRMFIDHIYPNPSKYWVTLDIYSHEDQSAVIDFYDQQGRSVYRKEVELLEGSNELMFDVSTWRTGAYNVIGRGNGHPAYGRFLKVWE
ncbi:MAG: CARDB domain-containing protein [Bacteroidota bacterium]